jgi:UDP-glucose 4,6-dehydratase
MIILFGSNGYIGSEFAKQLEAAKIPTFFWPDSHATSFQDLEKWYDDVGYPIIGGVINAAGYTGKPNVDACELNKEAAVHGNVAFPQMLTDWCMLNDIPLGHVSSGCIYTGKKSDGTGFTEQDEPNFSWTQNNCSFYSGTKALAEKIVITSPACNSKFSGSLALDKTFPKLNGMTDPLRSALLILSMTA